MLKSSPALVTVFLTLILGACSDNTPTPSGSHSNPDGGGLYLFMLMPPSGTAQGGSQVIVIGGGFTPEASVTFGSLPALSTTYLDAQNLMTFTPPSPAGAVDVTVKNPDGGTVVLTSGYYFTP